MPGYLGGPNVMARILKVEGGGAEEVRAMQGEGVSTGHCWL